ncbi:hypothetical protein D3C72_2293150 [compost metagenome]
MKEYTPFSSVNVILSVSPGPNNFVWETIEDNADFGIYSSATAAAASAPKVGRSTPGLRMTTLCPIDSFGMVPAFLKDNSTGSPALTRNKSLSNFI